MRYLILLLIPAICFGYTTLETPETEPETFVDLTQRTLIKSANLYVTDGGAVITTDTDSVLYDFIGYIHPNKVTIYDGWTGKLFYEVEAIELDEKRLEPFASAGSRMDYYFSTDGEVILWDGNRDEVIWNTDIGYSLYFPPTYSNNRIYTVSGNTLTALDSISGEKLWSKFFRYDLASPATVMGDVVLVASIDKEKKPYIDEYTIRRDPVYNAATGDVIASEYHLISQDEQAFLFEHFQSDKILYINKANPEHSWVARSRGKGFICERDTIYIIAAKNTVEAYDRISGDLLWRLKGYRFEATAGETAVVSTVSEFGIRYRCIARDGSDIWGGRVGDLIFYDLESEVAIIVDGENNTKKLDWSGNKGWTTDIIPVEIYGHCDGKLLVYDGRNLNALSLADGSIIWSKKFNAKSHRLEIIDGVPIVFNAMFLYRLNENDGEKVWEIRNDRTFASNRSLLDSPYVYANYGDVLYVMHSKKIISAIDVVFGNILWHNKYDTNVDLYEDSYLENNLLTIKGEAKYYYVIDTRDGKALVKYKSSTTEKFFPDKKSVGFTVGVDPYSTFYPYNLPE